MSESLNQGWNEAITGLALRGLKRAHVWASALSRFLSCSYLQSVSMKRNNSRATAKADTQLESQAGNADNTHRHTRMAHFVAFVSASVIKCNFTPFIFQ